jgi:hypothetical protein
VATEQVRALLGDALGVEEPVGVALAESEGFAVGAPPRLNSPTMSTTAIKPLAAPMATCLK